MPTLSERQDKSLDYLRATAALLVVGFHSSIVFPNLPLISDWAVLAIIRQGYIGVSLFLVLSGFLFMKLGLERGLPDNLGNFYINRLLRVGPLFLVIFTLATAIGRNNFEPGDLIYLFITNIGSPPTSDQFITGTAWSVSLELAFYLIFPYLGRFTRSGGIKYLTNLIFLFLFLKIAVFISSENFQLAMYSTLIGRMDQFFFGMIAAMVSHYKLIDISKTVAKYISILFAVIICIYAIWLESNSPLGSDSNQYLWILIPSLEAALFAAIVFFSFESCIRFKKHFDYALSQIALISYSLYLLHPAALKIVESIAEKLNQINYSVPQFLLGVCGLVLSLGISGVSYKFIEMPFLSLKRSESNHHNQS